MEPNDLNSIPPDDPHLEAWLRANAALPPLPEDGFPQRVLTALPPPVVRRLFSSRFLVSAAGALAGTVVAALPLLSNRTMAVTGAALLNGLEQLSQPAVGLAVITTIISLTCVFWQDLRRFLTL